MWMLEIKLRSYNTLPNDLLPQPRDFLLMKQSWQSSDKCAFGVLYVHRHPEESGILARQTKERMREWTNSLTDHTATWWIASSCVRKGEGVDLS